MFALGNVSLDCIWAERDKRCSLYAVSAIFALSAFLATLVTLWYPHLWVQVGDVVTAYPF